MSAGERAQLVLLAAAVVAVAFVPVVAAYLQLGYHGDVRARRAADDSVGRADRALSRGMRAVTRNVSRRYAWDERRVVAASVRAGLEPTRDAVDGVRTDDRLVNLTANASAARRTARTACPGDRRRGRAFGPCRAVGAVVVQDRANRTAVVAVAYDVRVADANGETRATLVVAASGDPGG